MIRRIALLLALLVGPVGLMAQSVRGVVTDSANRQPIAGAVVSLLDAGGATISRGISNERGEFRIADSDSAEDDRAAASAFEQKTRLSRVYRPGVLPPNTDGRFHFSEKTETTMIEADQTGGTNRCFDPP